MIDDDELTPEQQAAEDEEFRRTGSSRIKMKYTIKPTQKELERRLVEQTEGKFIKPKHIKRNERN